MEGGGRRLALFAAFVVDIRGLPGGGADDFDSRLLEVPQRVFRHRHALARSLTNYEYLGSDFQYGGEIARFKDVSLFTPPAALHLRGQNDDVGNVRLPAAPLPGKAPAESRDLKVICGQALLDRRAAAVVQVGNEDAGRRGPNLTRPLSLKSTASTSPSAISSPG
ncbi:unnamed protein product, partial [marine sediment metagenome]